MTRFLSALIALLLPLSLIACTAPASVSVSVSADLPALAETLLADASFTEELAPIDDATIAMLYGIDNAAEQLVYIGSGATPEEIALFAFATEEEAAAGLALAQMRITDQITAFTDYNAWEMPKLEDAFVQQYGIYVVLCVSCDEAAQTIIEEAFAG